VSLYQRAIEEVYWRHRIWPKERPDPKPLLDEVMPSAQLEKKVEDYLRNSEALEDYWKEPLSAEQLQAEMERMAQHTKQPEVLRELFEALGNDPYVIAECLARPALSDRLVTRFDDTQIKTGVLSPKVMASATANYTASATANYTLPTISDGATGCTDDTWTATSTTNAPSGRVDHTAVWTGSEMIVWTDHRQIDAIFLREPNQRLQIIHGNRDILANFGSASVSRRAENTVRMRGSPQFPCKGVFAPAAAND
jgi:hypothetical protein